jgi:hypothetical protein
VEQQTYDHTCFEVLVVGKDKYKLISENSLIRFDDSVTPLSPAKARNRGVTKTTGEIIAFTDADCIPAPDWLAVLAEKFEQKEHSVIGGGVKFPSTNYWTTADNVSMFHDYLSVHPAGRRDQLPSLNLAIRRSVFEQIGGFDERYPRPAGEDSDLSIRLRRAGYQLWFEPRAIVAHDPVRNSLKDLVSHSYFQGMYSTKVDPRYPKIGGLPRIVRSRPGVILFSPLLAAVTTLCIFMNKIIRQQYWKLAPPILLSKIAWCFGASKHPQW